MLNMSGQYTSRKGKINRKMCQHMQLQYNNTIQFFQKQRNGEHRARCEKEHISSHALSEHTPV